MNLFSPVCGYFDALVHPSARGDRLTEARHRAFIVPRVAGGLIALAALPVYLLWRGAPGVLEIAIVSWFAAPLGTAFFLSRTGRYEQAALMSSLALTCLVVLLGSATGGILSPAAVWLVLAPLEVACCASRRTLFSSIAFALAGVALLLALPAMGWAPQATVSAVPPALAAAVSISLASVCAAWLGSAGAAMLRAGSELLSAEEERYRLLALNMTDIISRHDANGIALFVSPAAKNVLGASPRELTGHGIFDRIHVADRPAYLKAVSDAAAEGATRSAEFRIKRTVPLAEGRIETQYIWVEMCCRPLTGAGRPQPAREVVGVTREITKRKLQEQAVEHARRHAEQADAAKGRFLATMSHELRTPLNAILGFSDMLMQEGTITLEPARRLEYARLIHESGAHLLSVVNLVLDVSKIESGNFVITPEPFAPAPILRGSCDLLALKAREAGLDLVLHVPSDLPEINADKRALKQILLNLLSNAVKFTREGQVSITAFAERDNLVVEVEDTGVGIAEHDLSRVGHPFFQARSSYDRPYDGTGLGLSIVKGLVALHGGTMEIASRVGRGTCVRIRLPLDCERARGGQDVVQLLDRAQGDGASGGPANSLAEETPNTQVKKRA